MKKVVFLIPGFLFSISEFGYQAIGKHFAEVGYKVVYVEIKWKYKRVSDYLKQFQTIYQKEKGEVNIFFGFSYGAMIAYLSAPHLKPDFLYLCSMAPYFKEDLKYIPSKEFKEIGKRRSADIEKTSFNVTAKKITCPIRIFFGEYEQMFLKRRVRIAKEKLIKVRVFEVQNVDHAISDKRYIESVKKEINNNL